MKNKKLLTFIEYLKINNFEHIIMNDDSYNWDSNRVTQIRKKFKKDYLKYLKNFKYTKFNKFEIMDI